ncbi:MAG TPA: hypothetical protein VFY36_08355, partial [Solirubrobacteraceae bacterium]|nr:hypothetical protein [Solirubrobacteraceae bacterium]
MFVRDLNSDGEPEVLLDLYTAGAHCCYLSRFFFFDGQRYRSLQHNFGDAGYRVKDFDGDGTPELVSADARFGYQFSSFASSLFPLQVWRYDGEELRDVTRTFPAQIRSDLRRAWRLYRNALRHRVYEPRGMIAAW